MARDPRSAGLEPRRHQQCGKGVAEVCRELLALTLTLTLTLTLALALTLTLTLALILTLTLTLTLTLPRHAVAVRDSLDSAAIQYVRLRFRSDSLDSAAIQQRFGQQLPARRVALTRATR